MWHWLRNSANQRLLELLGPALAAIAIAIWTVFIYFDTRETGSRPSVEAERGSIAVGGDVGGDIRVGAPTDENAADR